MAKTLQQLADYIETEPEIRNLINETVKYLQAAWPPEGATEVTVYQLKTVLTHAQIKALPTTPVELVPAPGANKMHKVIGGTVVLKAHGVDYTNVAGALWTLISSENNYLTCNISAELLLQNLGTYGRVAHFLAPSVDFTLDSIGPEGVTSELGNSALLIGDVYNGVTNYTGGHASDTLEVTVFYSIVDL